jgi:hypothetical protein
MQTDPRSSCSYSTAKEAHGLMTWLSADALEVRPGPLGANPYGGSRWRREGGGEMDTQAHLSRIERVARRLPNAKDAATLTKEYCRALAAPLGHPCTWLRGP